MHLKTPVIELPSNGLNLNKVFLKLDNLQPSGSFKIRGISNLVKKAIEKLPKNQPVKFLVSSSGGNAGISTAYVGLKLAIPVKVFVPVTTKEFVIKILQANKADVLVGGESWVEANEQALGFFKAAQQEFGIDLWEGHSTLITEIEEKIDFVIVSVGGGGLLSGVLEGLRAKNSTAKVIAVETKATSLGAKTVTENLIHSCKSYGTENIFSVVVEDRLAVQAISKFADDFKFLVEPACSASLSLVLLKEGEEILKEKVFKKINFTEKKLSESNILVVVCGGNSVTLKMITEWKTLFNL
ncbi:hypothetical protein HK099_007823 [Clydaea vesicula]|uniref:L-serine ammonia-lyase n=1 Tax=Clydaea vesicula TaxID=447962 RepID=A0AAD5UBP4_9FUNG|nr:hypothetical protein HK099_007823 [Clydaea vesicula]